MASESKCKECGGYVGFYLDEIQDHEDRIDRKNFRGGVYVSVYSECDECGERGEAEGHALFTAPLKWRDASA